MPRFCANAMPVYDIMLFYVWLSELRILVSVEGEAILEPAFHRSQSMILDVLFFRRFLCVRIYAQRSEKHLGGFMWLTCSWCLEALCYVEERKLLFRK